MPEKSVKTNAQEWRRHWTSDEAWEGRDYLIAARLKVYAREVGALLIADGFNVLCYTNDTVGSAVGVAGRNAVEWRRHAVKAGMLRPILNSDGSHRHYKPRPDMTGKGIPEYDLMVPVAVPEPAPKPAVAPVPVEADPFTEAEPDEMDDADFVRAEIGYLTYHPDAEDWMRRFERIYVQPVNGRNPGIPADVGDDYRALVTEASKRSTG